jgi:hypothetical protein
MKRPFAVTLLALGAFLIGFLNLLVAIQAFGVAVFGTPFNVLGSPLWASLMYGLVGVIWIAVGGWLWRLQPSGWLFVVVIAIFNLILYFMSWIGGNQAFLTTASLLNIIALILALLPGTRRAFGQK